MTEDDLEQKRNTAMNDPEQIRIDRLLTYLAAAANCLEAFSYAVQNMSQQLIDACDDVTRDADSIRRFYYVSAGEDLLGYAAFNWPGGPAQMRAEIDHFAERLNAAGIGFFENVSNDAPYHLLNDEERWDENMRLTQPDLDYVWEPPVFMERSGPNFTGEKEGVS